MSRCLLCTATSIGICISMGASANPISTQVLRLRQVAKTTHVQVTYGTKHNDVPSEGRRDGVLLKLVWTKLDPFYANTGSGVAGIAAQQLCDCSVPPGRHEYALKLSGGSTAELTSAIEVEPDFAPRDLGVGRDFMPWDQPEPTALQGLDCARQCVGKPDAGTAINPPKDDTGGCSVNGPPASASQLLLGVALLLGSAVLRWRRHRGGRPLPRR